MSHFFKYPINYTYNHHQFNAQVVPRVIDNTANDNDYRTWSRYTKLVFETYGATTTDNSTITHIYIKSKNLDNYSVDAVTGKGTGTGLTNQTIPANQVVEGFQHDLQPVSLEATEIEVTVTGTNTEVYEVMLLESLFEVDNIYSNVRVVRSNTGSRVRQNIKGDRFVVPGLSSRYKYNSAFETLFLPTNVITAEHFITSIQNNPNFTFAEDFSTWPDRVYPAGIASTFDIAPVDRRRDQKRVGFTIIEL